MKAKPAEFVQSNRRDQFDLANCNLMMKILSLLAPWSALEAITDDRAGLDVFSKTSRFSVKHSLSIRMERVDS
jgi:hypothetical protein